MKRWLLVVSIIVLSICLSFVGISGAAAAVITFESLYPGYETAQFLPASYAGFTWNSAAAYVTDKYLPGSGYDYGTIGRVSMLGSGGDPVLMSAAPFDFNGAYITAAWNTGQPVDVEGWLGGSRIYSSSIVTSWNGPYWFNFDFSGVDQVRFIPLEGGTDAGLLEGNFGTGKMIDIDNITYNEEPIPEPGTLLLLGTGLAGLAGYGKLRLRRKKKQ